MNLQFDIKVNVEKRADCWAAFITPFAMTMYGDTRDEVESRVREGVQFIIKHHSHLVDYLRSHNIPFEYRDYIHGDAIAFSYDYPVFVQDGVLTI